MKIQPRAFGKPLMATNVTMNSIDNIAHVRLFEPVCTLIRDNSTIRINARVTIRRVDVFVWHDGHHCAGIVVGYRARIFHDLTKSS